MDETNINAIKDTINYLEGWLEGIRCAAQAGANLSAQEVWECLHAIPSNLSYAIKNQYI